MGGNNSQECRNLWVLAHPDDEIFALHLFIEFSKSIDLVIYLTDGVPHGATFRKELRQKEATESWNRLSKRYSLSFFGGEHAISDGSLAVDFTEAHFQLITEMVKAFDPDHIITLDFEGGHQDHDVTSLIATSIATNLDSRILRFPAYRAITARLPLYAVMNSNGIQSPWISLSLHRRMNLALLSVQLMRTYRSQKSTWVGLGPFVIAKYLFGRLGVNVQFSSLSARIKMPNKFLYVNRKKVKLISYEQIIRNLDNWSM